MNLLSVLIPVLRFCGFLGLYLLLKDFKQFSSSENLAFIIPAILIGAWALKKRPYNKQVAWIKKDAVRNVFNFLVIPFAISIITSSGDLLVNLIAIVFLLYYGNKENMKPLNDTEDIKQDNIEIPEKTEPKIVERKKSFKIDKNIKYMFIVYFMVLSLYAIYRFDNRYKLIKLVDGITLEIDTFTNQKVYRDRLGGIIQTPKRKRN